MSATETAARRPAKRASKRPHSSHWLNQRWWRFAIGEWIALTLTFLVVILLFCLFFIRRETLEYHLDHTFAVRDPEFLGSALALSDPLPSEGNKIELLTNGDQYFPAMLSAIRAAQQTVNFAAYIFESDQVGHQFRDAFCERARAGVEVRVLLDGIGSSWGLDNSDVRMMQNAGCKFAYYHPTVSWRVDRTNRRLHRRLLVLDGRLAFTGSAGFGDRWSGHAQDKDHWRDTQVRVEGPIVTKLQSTFNEHWVKTFGEALSGAGQFPVLSPAGTKKAQVIASHSFSIAAVPWVQATAFAAAEKRIWITNPYCTPTSEQVDLLIAAVQRKVDVRLILPGQNNDQPLTKSAGRSAYGKLLENGVRIFEYQPAMIHTKSMVIDSLFSMLGSSNLDARSSGINEELDLVVYDTAFGRELERAFESDLEKSREYTLDDFRKRSLWERTTEWLALPFRSQL
jgi:cardiolipin synthase A/B